MPAQGKILVLTTDPLLARDISSAHLGADFDVRPVASATDAVAEIGWPFKTSDATALVVDVAQVRSAEREKLRQIHREKEGFSLFFINPNYPLAPAKPAPLRSLPWPLPEGFVSQVSTLRMPVVFLVDRTFFMSNALQDAFKGAPVKPAVLASAEGLTDFILSQQKGGGHVAIVPFPGNLYDAEKVDRQVRKLAPSAVCYHLSNEDVLLAAGKYLRARLPVVLPRQHAKIVPALLSSSERQQVASKEPILFMDQDLAQTTGLTQTLLAEGYHVEMAATQEEVTRLASERGKFHLAIIGMSFAYSFSYGQDAAVNLAASLRAIDPDLRFIFLVDVYPMERALREMSRIIGFGADDALLKPAEVKNLALSVRRALKRRATALKSGARDGERHSATAPGDSENLIAGRYDLVFQLGEGGMGVVYLASDRQLGRKVALKKMRPEIKINPVHRQKFVDEAKIVSHLSHPGIVGLHEILEWEDDVYLIFDYIDGKPLSHVLADRKRFSLRDALAVLHHVCLAVDYAHKQKILHRDLKLSNIMIDSSGYAKVMDFGLAREFKDTIFMLTQKEIGGTPAFMAPEQHIGRTGRQSDTYSLAVCLYQMLTGELPFQGPDFLAQKERLLCASVRAQAPELPASIDAVMAQALAPDPQARIQTPMELFASFKALEG